jgi:hypothetical protein
MSRRATCPGQQPGPLAVGDHRRTSPAPVAYRTAQAKGAATSNFPLPLGDGQPNNSPLPLGEGPGVRASGTEAPNPLSPGPKEDANMTAPASPSALPFPYADLVRAAVQAPSPDNNQPWRFAAQGDRLLVYLDPSRALPSDVHSMFDLIGLGAAIENACIAARQAGFQPQVDLPAVPRSPDKAVTAPRLAATITLQPGGQPDRLFDCLAGRCTCRKPFSTRPVADRSLQAMADAAAQFPEVRLDWIVDRKAVRRLAWLIAASDRIRFEYEPFHNELCRQLRFSVEEAEETRDGLDLRTLELPPGAGPLLRFLRPWRRMKWVHRLGLGRLLTLPSAMAVVKSGAIGVLSVPQPTSEQFLGGGRAMERTWLSAQAEGLSLQPLGSLPIFFAHAQLLGGQRLSPGHTRRIRTLIERFGQLLPAIHDRVLLLLFRLGYSPPPRFRSLRREADEVIHHPPVEP